ncbi:unnamed protein product [Acanthoscelides obtectus]|uniref:Uncharacterized protein n=1 Tax=Acanthoscelides obtectus TaxID=200917 RepID=A0A9P0K3S1_ACAOB|nr:unnamed protein product [Acanthoscelides obtectus]CAK1658704.1 hypothetical protein AOBTE_LOCUS21075 [Acanthoscelides obtectus]
MRESAWNNRCLVCCEQWIILVIGTIGRGPCRSTAS